LRRFIPNFVLIIKLIKDTLKKDEVKWTTEDNVSFQRVKKSIGEAPVLVSPYYSKEFLVFSFTYDHTIAIVPFQKNNDGFEKPIVFFSKILRDAEFKYDILEKQAYDMVKSLNFFKTFVLHSKVISYVPIGIVKEILMQPNSDCRRGKWLEKIQEYDMEIKITKLK
jgi:hypothetical protein